MSHTAPYRSFARQAVESPPPLPEPLSVLQRRALSEGARKERVAAEVDYVSALMVYTPRQNECIEEVGRRMRLMRAAPPGAQESLYVIGPTGTGKSSALLRAAVLHHNDVLARLGQAGQPEPIVEEPGWTHDLIPVIWTDARVDNAGKSVVGNVLSALMEGEPRGVGWEMANRLPKILPSHRTSLICIDDVHNFGAGSTQAERVIQILKNCATTLGALRIALAFTGNADPHTGEYNLTAHEQLQQRLVAFEMMPFDFDLHAADDPPANLAWGAYLAEWERALQPVLPDMTPGELASVLGRHLWNKTHGSLGALSGVLKRCVQEILENESTRRLSVTKDGLLKTPVPMKYARSVVA